MIDFRNSTLAAVVFLALVGPARAGTFTPGEVGSVTYEVKSTIVDDNGNYVGSGDTLAQGQASLFADEKGDVTVSSPISVASTILVTDPATGQLAPEWAWSLDSLGGNVDPALIFAVSGTNLTNSPLVFSSAFSLAISITGPIEAYSDVGYTLSAKTTAGATLFPILGGGKVVDSQDIRTSPFLSTDKQVDVGDVFSKTGFGTATTLFAEGPVFWNAGSVVYDLMTATVAFGLTKQSAAGVSGSLIQTPVPEPSTYALIGLGLAMVGFALHRPTRKGRLG